MSSFVMRRIGGVALVLSVVVSCGDDSSDKKGDSCTLGTNDGCPAAQVCEETTGDAPACFAPIVVEGEVTDALSGDAVVGALVVARDANGAAVSTTAETDADGKYSLAVPVLRDEDGNPAGDTTYTLRADANAYQSFPTAPRIALPVDMTEATAAGVVSTAATNIALIPLPNSDGLGTISGTVELDEPKGTLVVAGGITALCASDGTFTIFNVPEGDVSVRAYRQGFNVEPVEVSVSADDTTSGVTLAMASDHAATVSGKVEIVNPGAGQNTSVILVVKDTFVETVARGEAPPGLRVGDISGDFAIEGVPDGEYVVLAAFENDYLVRDPDTCIGGTEIVTVTVAGQDIVLDESFKITGALDVVSPDAEEVVSATPTFEWVDDSSEDHYAVSVYDAFGTLVWEELAVPGVSGSGNVTVAYAGPALESGMVYQYRASSIRKTECAISRTEDLRGVFTVE